MRDVPAPPDRHRRRDRGAGATTAALAASQRRGHVGGRAVRHRALHTWLDLGAADHEVRVEETIAMLGLPSTRLDQPMATLSGGEAAKIALASLLLAGQYDILSSTSPPTTSTSTASSGSRAGWSAQDRAIVVVSHDRAFLERTVTDVVELDDALPSRPATFRGEAGSPTSTSRRRRAGTPRRRTPTTAPRATTLQRPGAEGTAVVDSRVPQGQAQARRQRQERPLRSAWRPARTWPRRPVAPSGRWPGWRSSTSRGSRGTCSSASARPSAAATVVAVLDGAVVERDGFRPRPDRSRDRLGRTGRDRRRRTAAARRPCSTPCSAGIPLDAGPAAARAARS